MINKYKIILLILFLIVLTTGCDVKYRLHINYDGTFDDSIVIEESKDTFEKLGYDMKSYVEQQYEIEKKYKFYKDYYIQYLINDDFARISGEHSKWSLEDFTYSSLFIKSAFKEINVTNEDNKLIFNAIGNQMDLLFPGIHTDGPPDFEYNTIDLIITSDYEVLKSNADEVNKFKNEYIWHFTSDDYDKEIYIEMDSKQTLLGQIGANIRNNLVGIIILLVVAVIAIVGGIFFYKKYQEVNGV